MLGRVLLKAGPRLPGWTHYHRRGTVRWVGGLGDFYLPASLSSMLPIMSSRMESLQIGPS